MPHLALAKYGKDKVRVSRIVRHADGRLEGATDPRSDGRVVAW